MEIKVISYNSTGLSPLTVQYIRDLISAENPDILLLQETFTIQSTAHRVDCIHPGYLAHVVCGTDESKEILRGRPSGGVAILWKKSLAHCISKVKPLITHKRICAIKLTIGNGDLLICNAYLPNDNYSASVVTKDFSDVCEQVEVLYLQENPTYFIFAGDFNVDFRRQNAHSRWLGDLMGRLNLVDSWSLSCVIPQETYIGPNFSSKSRIDYISCSGNLQQAVVDVDVIKNDSNMSNHRPVCMDLHLSQNSVVYKDADNHSTGNGACVAWHKVQDHHIKQYQRHLDNAIKYLPIPDVAFCRDLMCQNPEHRAQIDIWCNQLTECCLTSGVNCLPKRRHKATAKAGWSVQVKEYKAESILWHKIWLSCGEPESGDVYECMKDAKRRYAYAARRVIRQQKQLRFERMAQNVNCSLTRNFWEEVKKMKRHTHTAPHIDGASADTDIAEIFRLKYEKLYKSVPSNELNMQKIRQYVDSKIGNSHLNDILVKESDVAKAVNQLKLGKNDGNRGFFSNHVKMAPKRLHTLIAILLTASTRHGYMPCELLISTLHSIPKDIRANICDSDNYRGIALSSCLAKVYDLIILDKFSKELCTSDMQYAFKAQHGTSMCTLVLKEVLSYFKRNGSDVFIGLVDASKAFDRVRHDKLFSLLIERGLPTVVIRLLLDSYRRQKLRTCWNKCCSQMFDTYNGIKQGSILSPVLFTVYMDSLLLKLEASGIGCKIGQHYFGALSYADDLSLLCPTLNGFQRMLSICQQFGEEFGVKYNPTKSVAMCVSRRPRLLPNVIMGDQPIKWVSVIKHLGNCIQSDLKESTEIASKRSDFIGRVNGMLATFYKTNDSIKRELFNKQCCHFYGAEAWNLAAPEVDASRRTWNHGVRRTFDLPYRTHTRLLHYFTGQAYVMDRLYRRFQKLLTRMRQSDNERVAFLAEVMLSDSSSIICKNLQCIAQRYGFNYYHRFYFNISHFKLAKDDSVFRLFMQFEELRNAKTCAGTDGFLTTDELDFILHHLCCE